MEDVGPVSRRISSYGSKKHVGLGVGSKSADRFVGSIIDIVHSMSSYKATGLVPVFKYDHALYERANYIGAWEIFHELAGIESRIKYRSKDDVVSELKSLKAAGVNPSSKTRHTLATAARRLAGGWNKSKAEVGLDIMEPHGQIMAEREMIRKYIDEAPRSMKEIMKYLKSSGSKVSSTYVSYTMNEIGAGRIGGLGNRIYYTVGKNLREARERLDREWTESHTPYGAKLMKFLNSPKTVETLNGLGMGGVQLRRAWKRGEVLMVKTPKINPSGRPRMIDGDTYVLKKGQLEDLREAIYRKLLSRGHSPYPHLIKMIRRA